MDVHYDRSRIATQAPLEPLAGINIHIIGCGVTGGVLARLLGKQGLASNGQLHVWDDDLVKPENLPNQVYWPEQVGMSKVSALAEVISRDTGGHRLITHHEKVTSETVLDGIVFTMLDSMAARSTVWHGCIKYNLHVRLLIDVRLAVGEFHLLSFYPGDSAMWDKLWYKDPDIPLNVCRDVTNMNSTANAASGLAVDWFWHFVRRDLCHEDLDPLPFRAVYSVLPPNVFTTQREG